MILYQVVLQCKVKAQIHLLFKEQVVELLVLWELVVPLHRWVQENLLQVVLKEDYHSKDLLLEIFSTRHKPQLLMST